jgi:transcriptional regulator with XRE-family HTH domain
MDTNSLSNLLKEAGHVVAKKRKLLGLSQSSLASRAGVNRTYISDLENGKRNFSVATLYALASSLNTTMAEMTGEVEKCYEQNRNDSSPAGA